MVICLQQGADLHMVQLMPLPLTVSCFSKIPIGFTFQVPAYPGSPGQRPLNRCVCVIYTQVNMSFLQQWQMCHLSLMKGDKLVIYNLMVKMSSLSSTLAAEQWH